MEEIKIYAILSLCLMAATFFTAFWSDKLILFRRISFAGSVLLSYLPFINRLFSWNLSGIWLTISVVATAAGIISMIGFVLVLALDPKSKHKIEWPYMLWLYSGITSFGICLLSAAYLVYF